MKFLNNILDLKENTQIEIISPYGKVYQGYLVYIEIEDDGTAIMQILTDDYIEKEIHFQYDIETGTPFDIEIYVE